MALAKVFFSDLKAGRCSSVVEARLLRFWEVKNVKCGGELMWMDLLMVDVNVSFRFRNLTELFGLANTNTQLPELNDEYGNSIWKNRVDSWKDKKSKKKKKHAKATKAEDPDAQVPPQQHMEDISLNTKAASATDVLTYPKTKITSYRIVIIMRLTILALFLHYRITHPVDSAYGLWLTSVICEIWFAFPWVLDQFRKWTPINRETYIDRLSARRRDITACSCRFLCQYGRSVEGASFDHCKHCFFHPVDKVSCYVSDDGAAMLSFESLVETADFARKWVPSCKKYSMEPRAPGFYFSLKIDYLRDKVQPTTSYLMHCLIFMFFF
ncbi:hypothetical protein Bca4012_083563 [Brassica carinata]